MYLLINLEKMSLLHKHPEYGALCNVARIECADDAYFVTPIENLCQHFLLSQLTQTEFNIFYRNIVGYECPESLEREISFDVVMLAIDKIRASSIDLHESDLQANFMEKKKKGRWKYVKGAVRPAKTNSLYIDHGRRAFIKEKVIDNHIKTQQQIKPKPKAAPAKVSSTSPKKGSLKERVWTAADKKWNEIGKPTDRTTILHMRKVLMDELEVLGIKRNSASGQLGAWQKNLDNLA